jgi:hypothetical protein
VVGVGERADCFKQVEFSDFKHGESNDSDKYKVANSNFSQFFFIY